MSFLDQFDKMNDKDANAFLFKWMRENPVALCEELRKDRPILPFWSMHPQNPETGQGGDAKFSYLLTDVADVNYALEHMTMKSYSRENNRYFLAEDDVQKHTERRTVFMSALAAVDSALVSEWMHNAVEEAWDLQLDNIEKARESDTQTLSLDVRKFSRDVALRFCGTFYGLPREQVVGGNFPQLTSTAFEHFIWKLYARHFDSPPNTKSPVPHLARIAAQSLGAAAQTLRADRSATPRTFTDHLIVENIDSSTKKKLMSNRDLVSNLIGGFQGFIDNAVSCTCIALDGLLPPGARDTTSGQSGYSASTATDKSFKEFCAAARTGDTKKVAEMMQAAQRLVPPAPWLPRIGHVQQLPSWSTVAKDKHPDATEAACILGMGSAMTMLNSYSKQQSADITRQIIKTDPSRKQLIDNDPQRYADPLDLRMGYGFHRCVGLDLGDKLVIRILMKIATLNDVKRTTRLKKKWSWIVEEFDVQGHASSKELATKWTYHPNAPTPVPAPPGTRRKPDSRPPSDRVLGVKTFVADEVKAVHPSHVGALTVQELDNLSEQQIGAFTERQLKALSARQLPRLGARIAAVPADKLVQLDIEALSELTDEQIEVLGQAQLQALFTIRGRELRGRVKETVVKHFGRLAVRSQVTGIPARPHTYSLWSPSFDTTRCEDYTCWPGLVDSTWTGRHLPPASVSQVSQLRNLGTFQSPAKPGLFTELFRRPHTESQTPSERTSLLFSWFAQWVSDSFLRTDLTDRRRNQSNHHVDLCQLYGLTQSTTSLLRAHKDGLMLSELHKGQEYLPSLFDDKGEIRARFQLLPYVADGSLREHLEKFEDVEKRKKFLFASALDRGNSSFGYTAISTLFLREHNRICRELKVNNPQWGDEQLFQTARMILTVILLKLVIIEYINHIAGPENSGQRVYRFDFEFAENESWYRQPRITLEFNLLYRWHCLVPAYYEIDGQQYDHNKLRFNNEPLIRHGLGQLLHDASKQPSGKAGLFNTEPELLAAEYAALKMSRDYRVDTFNKYRERFNLSPVLDFRDLCEDPVVINALNMRYKSPLNIDFLVGLYAEQAQGGPLFGALMTRMLAYDAFTQTFTNPLLSKNIFNESTFTDYGIQEILDTESLADLWKRNGGSEDGQQIVSFDL